MATAACPRDGPVSVHIVCADGSAEIKVDPVGTEGTAPPDPSDFVPTAAFHARMTAAFFSAEERQIVRELAAGPAPLKVLVGRLKLKRSKLATLCGNLKDRGVLASGDRGYELTPGPWPDLALALAGVAPPQPA